MVSQYARISSSDKFERTPNHPWISGLGLLLLLLSLVSSSMIFHVIVLLTFIRLVIGYLRYILFIPFSTTVYTSTNIYYCRLLRSVGYVPPPPTRLINIPSRIQFLVPQPNTRCNRQPDRMYNSNNNNNNKLLF